MLDFKDYEVLDIDTEGKTDFELLDSRPEVYYRCDFFCDIHSKVMDGEGADMRFFKTKGGDFVDSYTQSGDNDRSDECQYKSLLEIKEALIGALVYNPDTNKVTIDKFISVGGVFMVSTITTNRNFII